VQLTIDHETSVPPFEQVRGAIAARVLDGTLAVGTRLPTVRALAQELGIAINTVARAYRELEAAGVVETRGRNGTFVTAGGDRARERVREAAVGYARLATDLCITEDEAVDMVRAALRT